MRVPSGEKTRQTRSSSCILNVCIGCPDATFQDERVKKGYELDLGLHLKNLVAFATSQSRFLTVNALSIERLQAGWADACRGMQFALNFLRNNAGIESPALLSSPFLLIAVAYYGHKAEYSLDAVSARRLRHWVLIANAKGRYSRGSSETFLDQDLATLRDGGKLDDLVDRLRLQVGRLDVTPDRQVGHGNGAQ